MASVADIKTQITEPLKAMPTIYDSNYYGLALNYLNREENFNKLKLQDKETFLMMCARNKLDPTLKEIYPIMRGGKLTIVTNYLIYARRANETGLLDGYGDTEFGGDIFTKQIDKVYDVYEYGRKTGTETRNVKVIDKDKSTLWCKHTLYRKDSKHPYTVKIWLSEFASDEPGQWVERPRYMLEKCAFALNHRKAFQGCERIESLPYSEEEFESSENIVIPVVAEVTDIPKDEPNPSSPEAKTETQQSSQETPQPPAKDIKQLRDYCIKLLGLLKDEKYLNYGDNTRNKNSIHDHTGLDVLENEGWLDMLKRLDDAETMDIYYGHLLKQLEICLLDSINKLLPIPDAVNPDPIIDKTSHDIEDAKKDKDTYIKKLRAIRDKLKKASDVPFGV